MPEPFDLEERENRCMWATGVLAAHMADETAITPREVSEANNILRYEATVLALIAEARRAARLEGALQEIRANSLADCPCDPISWWALMGGDE